MFNNPFSTPEKTPEPSVIMRIVENLAAETGYQLQVLTAADEEKQRVTRIQPQPPTPTWESEVGTYKAPNQEQLEGFQRLLIQDFQNAGIDAVVTIEQRDSLHLKIEELAVDEPKEEA